MSVKTKTKGTKIFGIGLAGNKDLSGQTINIAKFNNKLATLRDEHDFDALFYQIGEIFNTKKIFSENDLENRNQKICWDHMVQSLGGQPVPFVYVEAELLDADGHPNAQSAAAICKYSMRPDAKIQAGFSVHGDATLGTDKTGQKTTDATKMVDIDESWGDELSLTTIPCNPICKVWVDGANMRKSFFSAPEPKNLDQLLAATMPAHAINKTSPLSKLARSAKNLQKSVGVLNYKDDSVALKCNRCGATTNHDANNVWCQCPSCGSAYVMSELYNGIKNR